jgi:hypothetical protein
MTLSTGSGCLVALPIAKHGRCKRLADRRIICPLEHDVIDFVGPFVPPQHFPDQGPFGMRAAIDRVIALPQHVCLPPRDAGIATVVPEQLLTVTKPWLSLNVVRYYLEFYENHRNQDS